MKRMFVLVAIACLLGCGDSGGGGDTGESTGSDATSSTDATSASSTMATTSTTSATSSTDGSDTGTTGADTGGVDSESSGDTGGATGSGCTAIIDCISACADDPCALACLENGSPTGQEEAGALLQCDETNACDGDQACLDANCNAELLACFTGPLSCGEVLACADACGRDDACGMDCYYEGTMDAQIGFAAILACIEKNGCVDDACIEMSCAPEIEACVG